MGRFVTTEYVVYNTKYIQADCLLSKSGVGQCLSGNWVCENWGAHSRAPLRNDVRH